MGRSNCVLAPSLNLKIVKLKFLCFFLSLFYIILFVVYWLFFTMSSASAQLINKYFLREEAHLTCVLCRNRFSRSNSNTTLKYHLNAKHAIGVDTTSSAPGCSTQSPKKRSIINLLSEDRPVKRQLTIPQVLGTVHVDSLKTALVEFAAISSMSLVASKEFRKICTILRPEIKLPTRQANTEHLAIVADQVQEKVMEQLRSSNGVTLTLDGWTNCRGAIGCAQHIWHSLLSSNHRTCYTNNG
jgi:hypothetical protein